jgi:hypothetical protein
MSSTFDHTTVRPVGTAPTLKIGTRTLCKQPVIALSWSCHSRKLPDDSPLIASSRAKDNIIVIEPELHPSIKQSEESAQKAGAAFLSCFTEGAANIITRVSSEILGYSDIESFDLARRPDKHAVIKLQRLTGAIGSVFESHKQLEQQTPSIAPIDPSKLADSPTDKALTRALGRVLKSSQASPINQQTVYKAMQNTLEGDGRRSLLWRQADGSVLYINPEGWWPKKEFDEGDGDAALSLYPCIGQETGDQGEVVAGSQERGISRATGWQTCSNSMPDCDAGPFESDDDDGWPKLSEEQQAEVDCWTRDTTD